MPTYVCTSAAGLFTASQKSDIVERLTRIHSEEGKAPQYLVQVVFNELAPGNHFINKRPVPNQQVWIRGDIRPGRTDEQKNAMATRMMDECAEVTGIDRSYFWVYICDAEKTAEFGSILPEPGGEKEWVENLPKGVRDRERLPPFLTMATNPATCLCVLVLWEPTTGVGNGEPKYISISLPRSELGVEQWVKLFPTSKIGFPLRANYFNKMLPAAPFLGTSMTTKTLNCLLMITDPESESFGDACALSGAFIFTRADGLDLAVDHVKMREKFLNGEVKKLEEKLDGQGGKLSMEDKREFSARIKPTTFAESIKDYTDERGRKAEVIWAHWDEVREAYMFKLD
ncbi:hypothetical protein LTR37_013470 [Vermiconidia calcicola]|uniref:Uncharacterized protein n=1 Tax=Vermiconidia calcicola TaxID=1690605 RepID=A0ACC3MXK6_9PEZI|nr:hypothetical protein LTR37_013470 [Vermiconidia calcicola]